MDVAASQGPLKRLRLGTGHALVHQDLGNL